MKFFSHILLVFKGIAIGVANIIPGVSGGTMAVMLGIYDQLIEAIGGFLTDKSKRVSHITFLCVLGIGAVIGLKGLAPVIDYSLENHLELTMLFFMGLITGSLPTVIKLSGVKKMTFIDMLALSAGIMLVVVLGASEEGKATASAAAGNSSFMILVLSGILAGGAMIVPGVSGSFVLILLGSYAVVLRAIDEISLKLLLTDRPEFMEGLQSALPTLVAIGIGCVIGVFLFSIIMRFLLKFCPNPTHCFIFGLVGASVIVLNKGFPDVTMGWLIGSLIFTAGTLIAHLSGKIPESTE